MAVSAAENLLEIPMWELDESYLVDGHLVDDRSQICQLLEKLFLAWVQGTHQAKTADGKSANQGISLPSVHTACVITKSVFSCIPIHPQLQRHSIIANVKKYG